MSKRINALREQHGKTIDAMEKLLATATEANRELTAEETKQYDEFKAEADKIEATIARETDLQNRKLSLASPAAIDNAGGDDRPRIIARPHVGSLKAFKGQGAAERAYRSGKWAMAALFGDKKASEFCAANGIPVVRDAMGGATNVGGGFVVPEEMVSTIIDLREEYGVFRRESKISPMSSDSQIIPRRKSGLTAYAMGENEEITASDKQWSQVSLNARKWAVLTRLSNELNEDAIVNIADDLANEAAYAFAQAEDTAGFNGTGTAAYHGIVGVTQKLIDGTHNAGKVAAASGHDTFAEIDATDIAKLMAALPFYAQARAKFYCSSPAFEMVFSRLMAAAGGNSLDTLTGTVMRQYLGKPVVISQVLPAGVATNYNGSVVILYGDLSQATTMGDRRSFTMAVSNDRYFEHDQLGVRATERFDINAHDLGDNTTAGPVVGLVATT